MSDDFFYIFGLIFFALMENYFADFNPSFSSIYN
jgi:hypothetical protein